MSDQTTGADLDQLDDLAVAYEQRGEEIGQRAEQLRGRLVGAVAEFQHALADLHTQTELANIALLDDATALAETAASTVWTGANRLAFDESLASLRSGIGSTTDVLATRISELEQAGVVPFNGMLEAFASRTAAAGAAAAASGAERRVQIAGQRAALQEIGDRGWSAV